MISMIFACDERGAIGKDGDLPWRQSTDLQHFKRITLNKTIVMGRKTWDSLGKALPSRRNIVMSRKGVEGIESMTFEDVLELAEDEEVIIIGGGEIYALFLSHAKEIHRTIIHTIVKDADTFAPEISDVDFYLLGEQHADSGEKDEHAMTFQHWIA
ncbi:MAG TPA: dihydrofolate reductase [Poseidonia sp.]|nr:dihydrofolate reductase [Poseidonia sp.]